MQVRIDNFQGLVLTKDPKKAPAYSAVQADNVDVREGSLDVTYSLDIGGQTKLDPSGRFGANVAVKKIHHHASDKWIAFRGNAEVAAAPLTNNTKRRIVIVGDGPPQITDLDHTRPVGTASTDPYQRTSYILGMPIPPAMMRASATGGSAPLEDRAYVYTVVSPWGEESAPCAAAKVTCNSTGATVALDAIGAVQREYTSAPLGPVGAVVLSVSFVLGTPNVLRLKLNNAKNYYDFRPGDRVQLMFYADAFTADPRFMSLIVSQVNYATGEVDCPANVWGTTGLNPRLLRVGPINRFNIIGLTPNSPANGKATIFVDTTEGLRAGERVNLTIGRNPLLPDLPNASGLYTVESVGTDPENPSFVVAGTNFSSYYVDDNNLSVAVRNEPHNTGEVRIRSIEFSGGTAIVICDSTASMTTGGRALIMGVQGAQEANGLRTVTVLDETRFSFPLTSMLPYTYGGIVVSEGAYPYVENEIIGVASAGGAAPYTVTVTLKKAHDFAAGQLALGYDVGGSVELNNLMVVDSVTTTTVVFKTALPASAWTAGGKLVRPSAQYRKRLYRTNTGNQGAQYQLIEEIPGEVCRYLDTKASTALSSTILTSTAYIQPPTDLVSIVAHENGFLAGLAGNTMHFCEPYKAHAWPQKYQRTLSSPGVGLGVLGNTVVAITQDKPVTYTGSTPATLAVDRIENGEKSSYRRSIISTGVGVFYYGMTGMFVVTPQGGRNLTQEHLPYTEFSQSLGEVVAAWWKNKLVWIQQGAHTGYVFDPSRGEKALSTFTIPDYNTLWDLHASTIDGRLWASYLHYVPPPPPISVIGAPTPPPADPGTQYLSTLFDIDPLPARFSYTTQYLQLPKPISFAALQVDWKCEGQSAEMKAREAAIGRNQRLRNKAALNTYTLNAMTVNASALEAVPAPALTDVIPTETFCFVRVWAHADNAELKELVFEDYVVGIEPVRIERGVKSSTWQVQVIGNARVSALTLAQTIDELKRT